MAAVNPYLTFDSTCEEAFTFYKSVFGGEFLTIMRFKDAPSEYSASESEGKKIMHVALPIGKGTILMGSDRPDSYGPVKEGDNFSIAIGTESEEEAKKLFNGLSTGGKVTMPLDKTFWGAYFGMFTDLFGINWMVNYDYNQQQ
jgi:PhnB protein